MEAILNKMLAQQFLMSAGLTDPTIRRVVDTIMGGGFGPPSIVKHEGATFDVPMGAETVCVKAQGVGRKVTVFLICENTD
jgi:hypothetical protein